MALKSVPPVTFSPRIILSFTGFQVFEPAAGSNAPPYFQPSLLNGPLFTAPSGATLRALLSLPAAAANGNCVAPGLALFAYGSAVGGGCAGRCCGCCAWPANAAIARAPKSMPATMRCFTVILLATLKGSPYICTSTSRRESRRAQPRARSPFTFTSSPRSR